MNLPKRKPTRLKGFDYRQEGYYFLTICTRNREKLLCNVVGDGIYDVPSCTLSSYGYAVDRYIQKMNGYNGHVFINKYVIMPNHVHLIVVVSYGTSQAPSPTTDRANATIPQFISLLKRYCHRECKRIVFQRSFHDHVIRNEEDYRRIWAYIDENPQKWASDCFYVE